MNGILIIAHAPLAHARECALHVFPDCGPGGGDRYRAPCPAGGNPGGPGSPCGSCAIGATTTV